MGCDIHVFSERKRHSEAPWCFIHKVKCDRDYRLFRALAGVRGGDEDPLFPVRGLPSDITQQVAQEYEIHGRDTHTPSWLTPKDIIAADWTRSESRGSPILEYARYLEEITEYDSRIVFWFDN